MPISTHVQTAFVFVSIALIVVVVLRPRLIERPSGRALAFVAFFLMPALATAFGLTVHLEHAKTTDFCLSCHVMEPYGESLRVDSAEHLPAVHFQNTLMPRQDACFACHTTYTMFGDFQAKLRGLKHVWVQYLGTVPEELALYEPYANRECLSCHGGARSFEDNEMHVDLRSELANDETSCLDCHDLVHDTGNLDALERWEAGP